MTNVPSSLFGQMALRQGLITPEQLEVALRAQAAEAKGRQLGRILQERGALTEADVGRILAAQLALRTNLPENGSIPPGARPSGAGEAALFGKYLLTQVLGRGRSQTYKVWDSDRKSFLTLKIGPEKDSPAEEIQRFHREAEAAARLSHPNIAKVHEVNEVNGRPYVLMDFIMGIPLEHLVHPDNRDPAEFSPGKGTTRVFHPKDQSLQAEIRRAIKEKKPLQLDHLVRLLAEAARAVHHAHESGVVHGNLKPHNVITDYQGRPILTDWVTPNLASLAREAQNPESQVPPPSYTAPERVKNPAAPVERGADVYSLGGILYECLTARPPYRGSAAEVLSMVALGDPPAPTELVAGLPETLEAVCLKAMHRKPIRRYRSALELAEDLEAFLSGAPVKAPLPSGVTRAVKAMGPTRAIVLGVIVLAVAAFALGPMVFGPTSLVGTGPTAEEQKAAKLVDEARALLKQTGRQSDAFELLTQATLKEGAKWEYYGERGMVALSMGRYADALKDFDCCIGKSAAIEIAYYNKARIRMEEPPGAKEDLEAAKEALQALLNNHSDSKYAKLAQARIFYLDGQPDKALERLESAEAACEHAAELHGLRGWILSNMEPPDLLRATQSYTRAIELGPNDERPLLHRARLLCRQGKHKESVRDLDRAISLSPGHGDLYFARGLCSADHLMEYPRARRDFDQALLLAGVGGEQESVIRGKLMELQSKPK